MISFGPSTVLSADSILVMDEGRLVEAETHDDLLKRNGAYAQLVRASGMGGNGDAYLPNWNLDKDRDDFF